jgi:hypothetical protein
MRPASSEVFFGALVWLRIAVFLAIVPAWLLTSHNACAQTQIHVGGEGEPVEANIQVDRYADLSNEDLDDPATWTDSDPRWHWDGKTWGRYYFRRHCVSCHGDDARGDGVMAPFLKQKPANLTLLWKRYGMPLPDGTIGRFIDGRAYVAAHGNRVMPIWGEVFAANEPGSAGEDRVRRRISRLMDYLNSIQDFSEKRQIAKGRTP